MSGQTPLDRLHEISRFLDESFAEDLQDYWKQKYKSPSLGDLEKLQVIGFFLDTVSTVANNPVTFLRAKAEFMGRMELIRTQYECFQKGLASASKSGAALSSEQEEMKTLLSKIASTYSILLETYGLKAT